MSIGLIVGTGVQFLSPVESWSEVPTPYGPASLSSTGIGGRQVVLLRRHGPSLNVPPHLINYHANFWALREAGVTHVLATAAVGILRRDLSPGTLAVMGDFIDFTKRRNVTAFDRPGESVVHLDFSIPYCPMISDALESAISGVGQPVVPRVVYVCVDGPRYETPSEVRMFAQWGGDVVGMTGVPEVVLAREMGMCYGGLAILTNYAVGVTEHPLSHQDVLRCVSEHRDQVHEVIRHTIRDMPETPACCAG